MSNWGSIKTPQQHQYDVTERKMIESLNADPSRGFTFKSSDIDMVGAILASKGSRSGPPLEVERNKDVYTLRVATEGYNPRPWAKQTLCPVVPTDEYDCKGLVAQQIRDLQ